MDPCPFQTPYLHWNQIEHYPKQCIGNVPSQISLYIVTATTTFLHSRVCVILSHREISDYSKLIFSETEL